MKIMVVDDVATNRLLTKAILKKLGFDAILASSCEEAWEIHKEESIDFFVLDWIMPEGMQGIELVKKIRAVEDTDYVYIILLTSKNRKEDIAKGITAGADDYIIKPFNNSEFGTRVKMGVRNLSLKRKIISLENENIQLKKIIKKLKNKVKGKDESENREKKCPIKDRKTILSILKEDLQDCWKRVVPLSIIRITIMGLKDIQNKSISSRIVKEVLNRVHSVYPVCTKIGWLEEGTLLIVLPELKGHQAKSIAFSIRDLIEAKPISLANNATIPVKAEAGSGSAETTKPVTVKEILEQAAFNI